MKEKKGDVLESESEEEEDDVDGNLSDEEVDFEEDEDFAGAFKEFDDDMMDEENIEFSDNEGELLYVNILVPVFDFTE